MIQSLIIEKAIRFLTQHLPVSDEKSRKPLLFHDIRVGIYLYEHGYDEPMVIAGFLHDILEWTSVTEQHLRAEFGDAVADLVRANTKDDSILDKEEKTRELITRCVQQRQDALIVKAADIMDSFQWYTRQNNTDELAYCQRNAKAILALKPNDYTDPIFEELKRWLV